MEKFKADFKTLDVLDFNKYSVGYLNR